MDWWFIYVITGGWFKNRGDNEMYWPGTFQCPHSEGHDPGRRKQLGQGQARGGGRKYKICTDIQ